MAIRPPALTMQPPSPSKGISQGSARLVSIRMTLSGMTRLARLRNRPSLRPLACSGFMAAGSCLKFVLRLESLERTSSRASSVVFKCSAASGSRVPFYLPQTLGGVGGVRSFNDEILGSDATKATLRGFRDLRFRGTKLMLLQAEYRLKIAGPIDATLFVDAGTVSARPADL